MSVLRLTIPVGMPDVHPRVRAVSQKLPGILLVLWVLTLPLEFTKRYFPNQVIELSRVVIVLALLTFVAQIVLERREVRLPSTTAMAALAAFLVYAAVSAALSTSAQGIKTVLAMVAYMAMMLTVFNWTRTSGDHRRVWTALAISAIVLAVVGLALHMTGSYIWNAPDKGILRVNATFGDPNIFARFLGIAIVTSVFLGADLYQRWRPAALWVAAALAATLILPYTYSRAGWVFTLVVLVTAMVIARNRKRALVLAAMVLAVFGLIALVDGSVLSRGAYLAQNLESPFTHPVNIDQAPSLTFLDILPSADGPVLRVRPAGFSHHRVAHIDRLDPGRDRIVRTRDCAGVCGLVREVDRGGSPTKRFAEDTVARAGPGDPSDRARESVQQPALRRALPVALSGARVRGPRRFAGRGGGGGYCSGSRSPAVRFVIVGSSRGCGVLRTASLRARTNSSW
ncbi:MAG: hypothetical protein E6I95_00295 [Chloroflexi bacterium]|nr:MAG: hypothetical protein E6I95_00295 [Chloroflexota bacterium]